METIHVIDSHTAGEPTRVIIDGGPDLGTGGPAAQLRVFREQYDRYRSAVVNEPRGSDVLVGAILTQPADRACAAGAVFFNNAGFLGMCGHGMMGVAATLAHLGRISVGEHRIETPVGVVTIRLQAGGAISIRNVACYRYAAGLAVPLECGSTVSGDVAWGGNWFFLTQEHGLELSLANVETLSRTAWAIRDRLARSGITGAGGAEIDHLELLGPPHNPEAHARSFVLCPGRAYDRSPCGTGTSAKLACLVADGKLRPGEIWKQEGILGTVFEGSVEIEDGRIIPTITGDAWVTAEARLVLDPGDPFCWGIRGE